MAAVSMFLIGKTGHGKSSTGNSLLGRTAFVVSDSAESVTSAVQTGATTRNGRSLSVIDGPGVGDTRLDNVTAIRNTCDDMTKGIASDSNGIGAFLLVLKYGNRFTDEEKSTLDSLKSILGENFVKDYCVIVFTHGEVFDMNNQTSGVTFDTWISQQTGNLGDLIAECGNRCVLAYNVEQDKMGPSIDQLLSHVDNLVSRNGPYTLEYYNSLEDQRQKLFVRVDAPRLQQAMDSEVARLTNVLSQIQIAGDSHDGKLSRLAALKGEVSGLKQRITTEEKGTGVLGTQKQACDSLITSVTTQEGVVNQAKSNEAEQQQIQAMQAAAAAAQAQAAEVRRKRKKKKFGIF